MIEKHPIDLALLAETYDIERMVDCPELNDWLSATYDLTVFEQTLFDNIFSKTKDDVNYFNEEELKMHFISSILNVANPNIPDVCKTFFERPLHGIIDNYDMTIVTDCMVASPRFAGDPDKPYFFLQEYKQAQRFGRTDPEGQMLAAMLIAQDINADQKTIFGCYVIERQWIFTTLNGREYCKSQSYNSTKKEDLLQIVFILRKLKELIINR